jgi:hypothetical protein
MYVITISTRHIEGRVGVDHLDHIDELISLLLLWQELPTAKQGFIFVFNILRIAFCIFICLSGWTSPDN